MSLQTTLTACLERAVENHEAAGINLLVLRDGEELVYAQAGMADTGLFVHRGAFQPYRKKSGNRRKPK